MASTPLWTHSGDSSSGGGSVDNGVGDNGPLPLISLVPLGRQVGARAPEEDWTGMSNAADRRRLQNRINQRARRKRKSNKAGQQSAEPATTAASAISEAEEHDGISLGQWTSRLALARASAAARSDEDVLCSYPVHRPRGATSAMWWDGRRRQQQQQQQHQQLRPEEAATYVPSPGAEDWLVLSNVVSLLKFNVFLALMENLKIVGVTREYVDSDGAISPFFIGDGSSGVSESIGDPGMVGENELGLPPPPPPPTTTTTTTTTVIKAKYDNIPLNMRPTRLQQTIPHNPWIDCIPIPGIRDNLLRALTAFDWAHFCAVERRLCRTLVGGWGGPCHSRRDEDGDDVFGGGGDDGGATAEDEDEEDNERRGVADGFVIWCGADPWDPCGWEMTEAFALRFGWLVRGCTDLFESTDRLRRQRGEQPFPFRTAWA